MKIVEESLSEPDTSLYTVSNTGEASVASFKDWGLGIGPNDAGLVMTGHIDMTEGAALNIEGDSMVKIGDFEINAKDLGKLLEKFAKEFMPQVLL
jgi:hypothetical protein